MTFENVAIYAVLSFGALLPFRQFPIDRIRNREHDMQIWHWHSFAVCLRLVLHFSSRRIFIFGHFSLLGACGQIHFSELTSKNPVKLGLCQQVDSKLTNVNWFNNQIHRSSFWLYMLFAIYALNWPHLQAASEPDFVLPTASFCYARRVTAFFCSNKSLANCFVALAPHQLTN